MTSRSSSTRSCSEERLGQRNAPVHADVLAGLLLQFCDELDQVTIDDPAVGPGFFRRRRGDHEFLDTIDEAGEWLDLARRPELGPLVVGPSPEKHRVLGGDDPVKVLFHRVIEVGDERVRLLCHPIE